MNWYVYPITPIDFGFEHAPTYAETLDKITEEYDANCVWVDPGQFIRDKHVAKELAREAGWEGDGEPHVFWVPTENEFSYGFVIKQSNNGTTFVISPVALPHLEEHLCGSFVVGERT